MINKPTNISLEDIECTRVDKEPKKTVHHKPHRYPTRQETWIQKVYEEIGGKNLDKKHLMEIMSEDVRPKTRHEHLTHMDNAINSAQDTQEWLTPLVNAVINDEMKKNARLSPDNQARETYGCVGQIVWEWSGTLSIGRIL